ncbi:MAG: hypothetical protein J6D34_05165 [Atopobiaceae bacterium]|nr:hypothetical protein [Atopobiaceae bacterium]
MKYRILLTTLYKVAETRGMVYYGTVDHTPRLYCDAPLSVEAGSKYVLSKYPIDEIIAIGESLGIDGGDPTALTIKDGRKLYGSDVDSLSNFDMLRYRLAQFVDEKQEDGRLHDYELEEDERVAARDLIQEFYQAHHADGEKFDRFFDIVSRDKDLQDGLMQALEEKVANFDEKKDAYEAWTRHYLYSKLKSSRKLELLDDNTEVKLSYVSAEGRETENSLIEKLGNKLRTVAAEASEPVDFDIYLCIHNEDSFDSYLIMSLIELAKMVPELKLNIVQTVTTRRRNAFITNISDVTAFYGSFELLAAAKAFLRYGKTELLAEYWERQQIDNPYITQVINALRIIDVGISLCDIGDIERGLNNLRKVLSEPYPTTGDSPIERFFPVFIESIKRDMASLLEAKPSAFNDLVRWTFQKGLLQQALTLVESRAPQDIVNRGIYYYCDSDESEARAIAVLGQAYYDLKPYEKYKLDDVSHYFVKAYGRTQVARTRTRDEQQRNYAQLRIDDLDTTNEKVIRGLTRCTDRSALYDLLYAYYHMSDVRNATNHAETSGEIALREDSDVSVRLHMIESALKFFIKSYDRVNAALEESDEPIRKITTADLFAYSRTLRPDRSRFDNRNREHSEEKQGEHPEEKAGNKPAENGDAPAEKPADNAGNKA